MGVYAKELLAFTDLPYTEPEIEAVFLSHAHVDHVSHIQFLDPKIRVCLGVALNCSWRSWRKPAVSAIMASISMRRFVLETRSKWMVW